MYNQILQTMENSEHFSGNENKPMFKPAFTYGLLTAVGLIALSLIIYFAGLMEVSWINYLSYLILLLGIVLGTKAYRDEFRGGFIPYGTALGFGVLTVFFAAVITAVYTYLFYTVLAPDALMQVKAMTERSIMEVNPQVSDQELDLALRFVSPGFMAVMSVFSYVFFGFLLSLITSAFLKKKDPLEA